MLSPAPGGAPVPCLTLAGPTNDSATVAVTRKGTVLFAPLATVTPAQAPAPADVAYPTDVARSVDHGAHWNAVVPSQHPTDPTVQHIGLIPWLYSDPVTGRVWYATPTGSTCGAVVSWSDDDGLTWTDNDSVGCPGQGGMSVFEGPAPAGQPQPVGYQHIAYYCANLQDNGPHLFYCYRSLDGGHTFTQVKGFPNGPAPPSCQDTLASPRGRVVAPDGTVYFLLDRCSEGIALSISHDEGDTWTQTPVTAMVDSDLAITSLAVDRNGTLYAAWAAASSVLPYLSISRDGGKTWSKPAMVGAPGVNQIDPRTLAIAVDAPGHVAIAYSGSTNHGASYNGYMAESANGLAARPIWWSAVMNDPRRPLETGPPSTLYGDREWFSTVTFAPDGTPWAGFQCDRTSLCPADRFGMVGHLAGRLARTVTRPTIACYRRRSFTITLPSPAGTSIRSARVRVNGHPVTVHRSHGHLSVRVVLRKRTRQTLHVTIDEVLADGRRYQQSRIYRPCSGRSEHVRASDVPGGRLLAGQPPVLTSV